MSYKRLIPCILVYHGKAVRWFDDRTVISDDVAGLAKHYAERGADNLIIFDLSHSDEAHEEVIGLIKQISHTVRIPVIAGGNIRRQEDVKKILYAGAKRAVLNLSRPDAAELFEEVSKRFGKERIAVSLNDFDSFFKQQRKIEKFCGDVIFMHRLDLDSVINITDIPCTVLTDAMEQGEIIRILKSNGVKGVSGLFISQKDLDFNEFKAVCADAGIKMTSFVSAIDFSEFKLNSDQLLPVVVQDHKTDEVLMVAYMNRDAFEHTLKSGRMTYFSRSRQTRWVKGETSGHYQLVKSLTADCDKDTLLAKVEQIGAACHTGSRTCFFRPVAGNDDENKKNPLQIFEQVYDTIMDRKVNPKEGSYTNYLFDKGIDKILKKVGEEATEIVIASKNPNPEEIKYEISDFLYHVMVLMAEKGVTWEDITAELADR